MRHELSTLHLVPFCLISLAVASVTQGCSASRDHTENLASTSGALSAGTSFPSIFAPPAPPPSYTVTTPGVQFVQIVAIGGAGGQGDSYSGITSIDSHGGGGGGAGAQVTAVVPVTLGETLSVLTAHNGDPNDAYISFGGGGIGDYGSRQGWGGGASIVYVAEPSNMDEFPTSRNDVLVVAGGGGGGGAAVLGGAGGNGGSVGSSSDGTGGGGGGGGGAGCGTGGGGGGGTPTGPGGAGNSGCLGGNDGYSGSGFEGGNDGQFGQSGNPGGGGGGGWYGGGGGGEGIVGSGGGGAGSSYVSPTAISSSITTAGGLQPNVTITPLYAPVTGATLSGTTASNNWFTSSVTVSLSATDQNGLSDTTYYAVDNTACAPGALGTCSVYSGSFAVSATGMHTLTYFSIDTMGLSESAQSLGFVIEPPAAAPVQNANLSSVTTSPSATTGGGGPGTPGSISANGTGTGVVGVAQYGSNPAGAPSFATNATSGTYFDVIVPAGSTLNGLAIRDCPVGGDKVAYWYNGTSWVVASSQSYDPASGCITIDVNGATSPSLSQLTGTVFASGHVPVVAASATTADGKPYTPGTWTNQNVTVFFTCDAPSAGRTLTGPITVAAEGANQSVTGTCTDALGEASQATYGPIDVDHTPPGVTCSVDPSIVWPPNGAMIPVTATVVVTDALSGPAGFDLVSVTSNEQDPGDIQGFVVGTPSVTGEVRAARFGNDKVGRVYTLSYQGKDIAGNTTLCSTEVSVPHNQ